MSTDDLAADPRWPQLSSSVSGLGIGSLLGVPVHVGRTSVGSLNVYRDATGPWDDDDIAALEAFAIVLEELLRHALTAQHRHQLAEQLDRALTNRVVIERAVGVMMAAERTDPVRAFNVLRDRARSERRKVADVADEILEAVQRPGDPLLAP